jgi:GTP-binding protein LepA
MQDKIRNFSIIAHIDHGKTTLTDALLRFTGTVQERDLTERMMDSNPIEQERGITIKMAPVRMEYQGYTLNLIDTPGHVDFGYEVSRSLAACEGVVLVVDASQGIQAQTLSHFEKATELGLAIVPVLNKIDLPTVDQEAAVLELMDTFGFSEEQIICVSAKTGKNIDQVLKAIIEVVPVPNGDENASLRGLVITSKYDDHKGVIAYVRVLDGRLTREKLQLISTDTHFIPMEIGVFTPAMKPREAIEAGEVGYIATGLKDIKQVGVGDTVTTSGAKNVEPLPGYKEPQPMVYMELYPIEADEFTQLQDSMAKLTLHDASLQYTGTHSLALGNGLRVGFLGILHAEIIRERLSREFDLELIATAPSVTYRVVKTDGEEHEVKSPSELPDPSLIRQMYEPIAQAIIYAPDAYLSQIIQFVNDRRGQLVDTQPIGVRTRLEFRIPLAEIIIDFHDLLKSLTSGYASLEYSVTEYQPIDAVKVDIVLNQESIEALGFITVRDQAEARGRSLVTKLKDVVPRQLFEIPIQAAIGGKIIARETVKAFRKDVTAKLYGGDRTRRMKLLKKQAKGKKRMKQVGSIELNQEAFLAVLEKD